MEPIVCHHSGVPAHALSAISARWLLVCAFVRIFLGKTTNWRGVGLRCGDHIKVWRWAYYHHGIYLGNGEVIHFCGGGWDKQNATVHIVSLKEFSEDKAIEVVSHNKHERLSPYTTIKKAIECLGSDLGGYNLLKNNCEHFAYLCKTGTSQSKQAEAGILVISNLPGILARHFAPRLGGPWGILLAHVALPLVAHIYHKHAASKDDDNKPPPRIAP